MGIYLDFVCFNEHNERDMRTNKNKDKHIGVNKEYIAKNSKDISYI